MAMNIRIAVIGPRPVEISGDRSPASIIDTMATELKTELNQVLPDEPDIILFPEVCDRPADMSPDERKAYYRARGNTIRDGLTGIASDNNCYVVYPAVRELPDGTFRNSSSIIDRDGSIAGVYDKNHVAIEETTEGDILCGSAAPVFDLDFGRVACAICFDLNFDELKAHYAESARESPPLRLVLFSSMYHGGIVQQSWAYTCRSYFAGAIAGLPSEIRNPFGEVVATSTNYRDYAVAEVNLDYCLAHFDYHWEKLIELKKKYGPLVDIHDPGLVGSVMISSLSASQTATEMAREFEIELLDDYFDRARSHHRSHRG